MRIFCVSMLLILFMVSLHAGVVEDLNRDLEAAIKAKNLYRQTTIHIKLGENADKEANYSKAIEHYLKAYDLSVQRKHIDDQVFICSSIGNCYDQLGKLNTALQWYGKALDKSPEHSVPKYRSYIHNNMGNVYLKIGSFSKSLEQYQHALDIKLAENDTLGIANAYINMGALYLKTGNLGKTLELQLKALQLRKQKGDQNAIASALSSISVTYRNMKRYDKAFEYNKQALDIYQSTKNTPKIASTYNNLGVLYLQLGDAAKALEMYQKSYNLKKDSADMHSILMSLINLADVNMDLRNYSEARRYLDQALGMQFKEQQYDTSKSIYKLNSLYYEGVKDYKKALENFKIYHAMSDSLANEQKMNQLNELEVKYELREKERNIELLEKNNELSQRDIKKGRQLRNSLMLIISLILLSLFFILWRYYSVLRLNRAIAASKEELNRLNLDLEKRVEIEVSNRRQQEQRALRQSRLAILGELAAGIAHEMNQPLQTLSFTLENIKLAILDNQIDQEYLERKLRYLFEDISRMQDVIEHIRCFSRQSDDPHKAVFDVNSSILDAISMVKDRLGQAGIEVKTNFGAEIPSVLGNKYKFEHVILNLLTNARDAIIEAKQADESVIGTISIESAVDGEQIQIKVSDNGCGVPEEMQDRVFDIFYTTKSVEKGTGLGLSITLGIIKGMGGSMELKSDAGCGTEFVIYIPTSCED